MEFNFMPRSEFSIKTKRAALERSGGYCEGEIILDQWDETWKGKTNTFALSHRCNVKLGNGVEFDHILACSNGGDNSLSNCQCLCRQCHKEKTFKTDLPRAAKTKRMSDKAKGIKKSKYKWPKRKFGQ